MGFWKQHYLIPRRSLLSSAQTEVFDLPKVGILSDLMLEFILRSGTTNIDVYVADFLSKVEIIGNGSTVIKSYTGKQIQAIMAFDDLVMPPDKEYSPSGGCYGYFDIRFGRFPGDEKYALDCSQWQSLELKITYDLAAGATADTTGFLSTWKYLIGLGLYAPVGAGFSPVGLIKSEQKKTYTTSVGGTEDLNLPSDYPYRRLLLFTDTHGIYPNSAFNYTTININEGAKKPLDRLYGEEFIQWQSILLKHRTFTHYKRYYVASGTNTIHPPLGFIRGMHTDNQTGFVALDPNEARVSVAATGWAHIDFDGLCPWRALVIDLEKQSGGKDGQDAMKACWDATEKDDINLEIEENAVASISILLEQYAPPSF